MLRNALHIIAATLLWVVFIYYWWIVSRRPMNPDTKTALITLAVLTAVCMLCLAGWVIHNVRIYRTLHRRKARRSVALDFHHDFLGRRVVMDPLATLKRSSYIDVEVERGFAPEDRIERKIFRPRTRNGVRF